MRFSPSRSIARPRRFLIALASAAAAVLMLHAELASALVDRGDQFYAHGQVSRAQRYYMRARWLDSGSGMVIDRNVVALLQTHTPESVAQALHVANDYLRRHPNDATVLADRGMCYLLLRRYRRAANDYTAASFLSPGDPSYRLASRRLRARGERSR